MSIVYEIKYKCYNKKYKCYIKTSSDEKKYVGLTEVTFKRRLHDHSQSFRNSGLRNTTELSKYIWELNDEGKTTSSLGTS